MEFIKADWVKEVDLEILLQKKAKSSGLFSKNASEELESFKIVQRPFRKVILSLTRSRIDDTFQTDSLIDEELTALVHDEDHKMLLWRPKYRGCSKSVAKDIHQPTENSATLQSTIDDMMEKRWQAQEYDKEMQPQLRRVQLDPLSTIAFLMPRTPGGLKKEKALIEDRKASHAYILATSLVTNSSPKDIVTSADIGETILVETILAVFKSENGSSRLLALETPCTNSFSEAIRAGKALTRLCDLYGECREIVSNTPK